MCAPRAWACSSSSSTSTPAPSPITKPSRLTSKGWEAPCGSSLWVLRARAAANPDTPTGLIGASLPPANMTSAAPSRMRRAGVADGVGGRGAGRAGRAERALGAELERDVRRAHVGDHHRDQQRVGAVRSLVEELVRLDVQRLQAADAAGHHRPDPLGLGGGVELGVLGGVDRGGDGVAAEEVEPARLALVDVVLGDEALDLGGDVHLVAGRVEAGDLAHAGVAGHEPAPEGVHVVADRRDDAQTGDDDSALVCHAGSPAPQIPRPPSTGRVTPVTKRAAGEAR